MVKKREANDQTVTLDTEESNIEIIESVSEEETQHVLPINQNFKNIESMIALQTHQTVFKML